MSPSPKTQSLLIYGKVQGVGFRQSLVLEAGRLNLAGWCRNTSDGAVEAWVSGEVEAVSELLAWCRTGPPIAQVLRVDVCEERLEEALPQPFEIRR